MFHSGDYFENAVLDRIQMMDGKYKFGKISRVHSEK